MSDIDRKKYRIGAIDAVVLDFYGTVVEESDTLLDSIAEKMRRCGARAEREKIASLWWTGFRARCDAAYGAAFRLQREIYPDVFAWMEQETGASGPDPAALAEEVVSFAETSPIFADAVCFVRACPLPYYILSNIDNMQLYKALSLHGLHPKGVFTSEDAREYKPREGIFRKGMQKFGLRPERTLYVGDSLVNDHEGARSAGLLSVWLNRKGDPVPEGAAAVRDLMSLLPLFAGGGEA